MTLVKPQRQDERNGTLSSLNAAIGTLDLAGEATLTTPVKVVSSPVRILLATIRVSTPQPASFGSQPMYTGLDDRRRRLR